MNPLCTRHSDQGVSEGLQKSNPASSLNLKRGREPQITILTGDQQAQDLLEESRQHRYGVFIGLTLATTTYREKCAGLRWRRRLVPAGYFTSVAPLGRLSKWRRRCGSSRQTGTLPMLKARIARRSVLLRGICADLEAWRNVQQFEHKHIVPISSGNPEMVLTNELRTHGEHCLTIIMRLLEAANLPHFTFHALRHTFATRALEEQGMDPRPCPRCSGTTRWRSTQHLHAKRCGNGTSGSTFSNL